MRVRTRIERTRAGKRRVLVIMVGTRAWTYRLPRPMALLEGLAGAWRRSTR